MGQRYWSHTATRRLHYSLGTSEGRTHRAGSVRRIDFEETVTITFTVAVTVISAPGSFAGVSNLSGGPRPQLNTTHPGLGRQLKQSDGCPGRYRCPMVENENRMHDDGGVYMEGKHYPATFRGQHIHGGVQSSRICQ